MIVTVYDVLTRTRHDGEALVIQLKVHPTPKEARRIGRLLADRVKARDAHYHHGDNEVRILFSPGRSMSERAIQGIENELTLLLADHVFENRRRQHKNR